MSFLLRSRARAIPLAARLSTRQAITRSKPHCRTLVTKSTTQKNSKDAAAPIQATHRSDAASVLLTLKKIFLTAGFGLIAYAGFHAVTDTRFHTLHRHVVVPLLRYLYPDGEAAHHAGTAAMKKMGDFGINIRERGNPDAQGDLAVEVFGETLWNPIGTSAGIDKGAEVPDELLALGGSYVEVGGIVPEPQAGNPKPRLFRVVSQNALINRFGLNSDGADKVAARLRDRVRAYAIRMGLGADAAAEQKVLNGEAGVPPGSLVAGKLMGVQISKNKETPDDVESVVRDYVTCVEKVGKYGDIIVVNVSSPNTEGLRDLQAQGPLTRILTAVTQAAQKIDRKTKPRVMVKVSPDEDSQEQVSGICQAIYDSGVDGVIVGNTTRQRPSSAALTEEEQLTLKETGGYSGPQLFPRTVNLVGKYRQTLDDEAAKHGGDKKVIFGSGGITNGRQALEVLKAGADMVQIYTALVYGGAGTVTRMKRQMRRELNKENKDE